MDKKKNQVTILYIPDGSGRTVSIHIHRGIIQALVVFCVLFTAGMASLLYLAGDIALKLQLVDVLKKENQRLHSENEQLYRITGKLDNIQRMHEYLSRLARAADGGSRNSAAQRRNAGRDSALVREADNDSIVGVVPAVSEEPAAEVHQRRDTPQELFDALPYLRPVEGWVTRGFSSDSAGENRKHEGVDFAAAQGALIRAAAPGVIREVQTDVYFGRMVTVEHRFGFVTRYGHCSQVLVSPGDHVERGQSIALVGNTGRSSAPHLHYEVVKDGRSVDPFRYILTRQP